MHEVHGTESNTSSLESQNENNKDHALEKETPEQSEISEGHSDSAKRDARLENMEKDLDNDSSSETKDVKSPSDAAKEDQTESDYSEDDWHDTTIESGTKLYQLSPGGESDYYTTEDEIKKADYDTQKVNEGLQVAPDPEKASRSEMKVYEAKSDLPAAESTCEANKEYGDGGMKQYYIPDSKEEGELEEVDSIQLNQEGENDDN